jgi:predicted nucleotidyltransferase
MRPSVVLDMKRSAVREAVSRFRTANPRVFGSVLHGTDRDGSDLDLLVDALPGATLLDLGGLQDDLESLLGIHVDLLTPGDLPPKFRAKVLAEAQPASPFSCTCCVIQYALAADIRLKDRRRCRYREVTDNRVKS